ncbi:DUF1501 domain-containing protein [Roseicyclus sp. F158]|uniref:DUF1501 domain-containing protein n=1 Tax=Tropicimonas omnivorans TaxID=3075590 RepID=A0ABU3DFC3_9RHOB|nr:DUF1501 domain-containing protein [Roseicyclus sp. F158]MDT0682416.1 DUF1501 domain-containing protein [Roseicyclus sp. F158]
MIDRRSLLLRGAALGCSAAASPLITPVALASAPWDARLVVVILRGAMDGLDAIRPVGDPHYAELRPGLLAAAPGVPISDFWALHPALSRLVPLWEKGELAFAHAVSTPYRDKRSHFDGQDLLEAGTGFVPGAPRSRDGWLNRMLQVVPGMEAETAFAVGRDDMLLLTGDAQVANWAPEQRLTLTPQAERLLHRLYAGDPLFASSVREAIALTESLAASEGTDLDAEEMEEMSGMTSMSAGNHADLARFTADRLRRDTRVAAFSLTGWDTHNKQIGGIDKALTQLSDVIEVLQVGLGDIWGKTAVLAMTEFGRTARENGSGGTDHGTGGAMLMAGGAVRGGKAFGAWPGLSEGDLYDRRDLMPTGDVRAFAARAMEGLFGLDPTVLESAVFPGLDMAGTDRVIL